MYSRDKVDLIKHLNLKQYGRLEVRGCCVQTLRNTVLHSGYSMNLALHRTGVDGPDLVPCTC